MKLAGRFATPIDAHLLAALNAQLIRDEGHSNSVSVPELQQRMGTWLQSGYQASLFEIEQQIVAYALYRRETEHVYLRQFFVVLEFRRKGVGRAALEWLWANPWRSDRCLRIDVLVDNVAGQQFWRAVGLKEYCLMMEMERPSTR